MYKATDFNLTNAPADMVQYVIDNVEDFEPRYEHALNVIGRNRCPLSDADYDLFEDINDAMSDWAFDNDVDEDEFDIEEIFG